MSERSAPSEPRSPDDAQAFLGVAKRIGERLGREAQWDEVCCTWTVPSTYPETPSTEAGPFLYNGTAGIAWFLMQLYRQTGEHLETGRDALRWSLRQEAKEPKAAGGYYSGTAGLVATLVEMASLDGDTVDDDSPWLDEARMLGEKIARGLKHTGSFDLMAGEAGSLLGLLRLHQATGDEASLAAAQAFGDELIEGARREVGGVSWDIMHPQVFRNLLGSGQATKRWSTGRGCSSTNVW